MTSEYGSDIPPDFIRSESYPHDQLGDQEPTHSDDLRIREAHLADIRADNNKRGIVVQHRAWTVNQAFLSDHEQPHNSPSAKYSRGALPSSSQMPSSPPMNLTKATTPTMENESPGKMASARKRIRLDEPRSPLKPINGNVNRTIGGFIIESEDEDEDENELTHKSTIGLPEYSSFLKSPISSPVVQASAIVEVETKVEATVEPMVEPEVEISAPELTAEDRPRPKLLKVTTSSGRATYIGPRLKVQSTSYERIVAARSVTQEGKATKSFYGIDMHNLLEEIQLQKTILKAEKEAAMDIQYAPPEPVQAKSNGVRNILWTEKYRARKFTDLIGDERTHRMVMHWLKSWDSIVFPGINQPKKAFKKRDSVEDQNQPRHAKVLLLTGPPGLGKTTLAHVCARQAGYEVHEINASDDRKVDVVKGKIRDMVGTENVRGMNSRSENGDVVRKAGRPVCVVVDEVDGATGSRDGEGGFVKALIDLIQMDQRNAAGGVTKKGKKSKFRFLRPLILVCNDVYHPSLRPLRQSSLAEIVHVRKPAIQMVSARLHSIFEREGVQSDADGVRRLCEATWGISTRKDAVGFSGGTSNGDVRSVLVVGEWVASRFKAKRVPGGDVRLTKRWIEEHVLSELAYGGSAVRSLGRGSSKEVVERVFLHEAGFLKTPIESKADGHSGVGGTGTIGVAEAGKRRAMNRLKDLVDASGEIDRVVTDIFTNYPDQPIQDDNYLTKPNAAYEWLNFYDRLNTQLHSSQEWEVAPYLSSPVLAFHNLFASSASTRSFAAQSGPRYGKQGHNEEEEGESAKPFTTPAAPYTAAELLKANGSALSALHGGLSIPLQRTYRSRDALATELLPYVTRMLSPNVKPVIIQVASTDENGPKNIPMASVRRQDEKDKVERSVEAMAATGVRFDRSRVDGDHTGRGGGWVYRMEPGLDSLVGFETMEGANAGEAVRFAVRQVLEGEWTRRSKRHVIGDGHVVGRDKGKQKDKDAEGAEKGVGGQFKEDVKRDFFGRVIKEVPNGKKSLHGGSLGSMNKSGKDGRVWVSFHEGYSNAVRRPITLEELMRGF